MKVAILALITVGYLVMNPCAAGQSCPQECSCSENDTRVSCNGRRLSEVPKDIPKTVIHLSLTHNSITKISVDDFQGLVHMEELDLSVNAIHTIEDEAFSTLNNLKTLMIASNSLKTVSQNALRGLLKLESLHLGQNSLLFIPDLGELTALKQLILGSNKLPNASFPVGFEKLKNLSRITLTNNEISALKGTDLISLSNSKVSSLYLARNKITHIANTTFAPIAKTLKSLTLGQNDINSLTLKGAFWGLRTSSLVSLDISELGFSGTMAKDTFLYLKQVPLRTLTLSRTTIRTVEAGTFEYLTKLEILIMERCEIQNIDDHAFENNPKLTDLRLNDHNFLPYVPKNLPKGLKKLGLNNNRIGQRLSEQGFGGMNQLEELYLSGNLIREVPDRSFDGLWKLKILDLSHNNIASMGNTVFSSSRKMYSLKMNNNNLGEIKSKWFASTSNLKFLDLSHNKIYKLPSDFFSPAENLETLNLQSNQMGFVLTADMEGNLFKNLNKLKLLNMANNRIDKLFPKHFRDLVAVSDMKLEGNKISNWESEQFKGMKSLKKLDLSRNLISVINSTSLTGLEECLNSLNLSGNPFACTCDLAWFRHWINNTNMTLPNLATYKCYSPKEMFGVPLLDFHPENLDCQHLKEILIFSGSALGVLLTFTIIIALVYRRRWYLRLKLFRLRARLKPKCKVGLHHENDEERPLLGEPEPNNNYHAYISCCDKDKEWVEDVLLRNVDRSVINDVQCQGEFSLYYPDRDEVPGRPAVENMLLGIEGSQKVIVIMSREYIKDAYCTFELDQAIMNPKQLVLVMKDGIPLRTIPKSLHRHLEERQYITWTEDQHGRELFWQHLRERLGNMEE